MGKKCFGEKARSDAYNAGWEARRGRVRCLSRALSPYWFSQASRSLFVTGGVRPVTFRSVDRPTLLGPIGRGVFASISYFHCFLFLSSAPSHSSLCISASLSFIFTRDWWSQASHVSIRRSPTLFGLSPIGLWVLLPLFQILSSEPSHSFSLCLCLSFVSAALGCVNAFFLLSWSVKLSPLA